MIELALNKKEADQQNKLFKILLERRVNKLRPHINIDLSKQMRGVRFNDNEFIYTRIVEAVTNFQREVDTAFEKDQPVDFLPQSVENGTYDRLIIDTLHVCSVADHIFENNEKYH